MKYPLFVLSLFVIFVAGTQLTQADRRQPEPPAKRPHGPSVLR